MPSRKRKKSDKPAFLAGQENMSEFKKRTHYDSSTPRCGNCKNFAKVWIILRNSLPVTVVASHCKLPPSINTSQNGLCDSWTGRDGATLEQRNEN